MLEHAQRLKEWPHSRPTTRERTAREREDQLRRAATVSEGRVALGPRSRRRAGVSFFLRRGSTVSKGAPLALKSAGRRDLGSTHQLSDEIPSLPRLPRLEIDDLDLSALPQFLHHTPQHPLDSLHRPHLAVIPHYSHPELPLPILPSSLPSLSPRHLQQTWVLPPWRRRRAQHGQHEELDISRRVSEWSDDSEDLISAGHVGSDAGVGHPSSSRS